MKKITIYSLCTVFIFSLVFPGQTVFARQAEVKNLQENSGKSQNSPILIKVIAPAPEVQIILNYQHSQTPLALSCRGLAGQGSNILFNTAAVNLNQPADCFSLQTSPVVSVGRELSVKLLAQANQNIIVVSRHAQIAIPSLAPAPFTPTIPFVPLASFAITLVFLSFSRRFILNGLALSRQLKSVFTPNRLQIMRC